MTTAPSPKLGHWFAQGIKKREEEAGKDDGFSNPQIRVGEKIRPVLQALEARLDSAPR